MMAKKHITSIVALLMLLVAAANVWAHPGHGDSSGHSLMHYLIEPFHSLPLIAVIVLSVVIFLMMYSRRKKRAVNQA